MEVIKDENGKEITVELVLVKNIDKNDCDKCALKDYGCGWTCKPMTYYAFREKT